MPEQPTILCVDDEERALFLRKAVLEKFGFRVFTASSGKNALELLEDRSVDLVLSDLLMPEMSGTELAKLVRQQYPEVPFVIVSGVNEIPADVSLADLFVSKLEGPATLCERLRDVLHKSKTAQGAT